MCLNVPRKEILCLLCETSMEQLSQGKAIGMLTDKHFFQKSLGIRRTERLASTALPLMVMLMIMQSAQQPLQPHNALLPRRPMDAHRPVPVSRK